ncbi:MAG TPA: response regulator [Verrucomicrobiae bacterium]|nr:response regulator [Verrucomicrobiae bacterium]
MVDDNNLNLLLVRALLDGAGYDLAEAGNAAQALEAIDRFKPHLMLLDIELPDRTGLDLARELKANARTRDIVLVVLSAHAGPATEAAARAAGAEGFIGKPIEPGDFRHAVAGYLALARS